MAKRMQCNKGIEGIGLAAGQWTSEGIVLTVVYDEGW